MNQFDSQKSKFQVPADRNSAIENSDQRSGYIFLTGASGLVGQFLIKDLLLQNQKLALLIRPGKKQSARSRVEAILQRWESELGHSLPRPIVLQGDLANEKLSLSDDQIKWLTNHCDRIIHNAAVLTFNGVDRNHEPWLTNLYGTRNVLNFCRTCGLKEMHYVSTAYVSGLCETVFKETDFDIGQKFRNDYERSKFEAEKLVRQSDQFTSTTIYRPAVISGDSKTGFSPSYHGVYVYLRLMATMIPLEPPDENGVRQISIELPMQGDEPRNLVAVDWVSSVMTRIVCDPQYHNETYHLVPDTPITARKLVHYSYDYFNSTGTTFSDSGQADLQQGKFANTYLENMSVYSDYEQTDPLFDNANIKRVCGDLVCTVIDKDIIFKYYDYGIKDKWGKRKTEPPVFECWLAKHRQQITDSIPNAQNDRIVLPISFAVNVVGPGGGAWTFNIDDAKSVAIEDGIAPGIQYVLHLESSDDTTNFSEQWRNLLNTAGGRKELNQNSSHLPA